MSRPPLLYPRHVLRSLEVVAAFRRGPPLGLTCPLAGPATLRLRAVFLVPAVAVVGLVQISAATALAPSVSFHPRDVPAPPAIGKPRIAPPGSTHPNVREEDGRKQSLLDREEKKNRREEDGRFKPAKKTHFHPGRDIHAYFTRVVAGYQRPSRGFGAYVPTCRFGPGVHSMCGCEHGD